MSIDKIVVIVFSVLGILSTFWFFLMKKESDVFKSDNVDHHEHH